MSGRDEVYHNSGVAKAEQVALLAHEDPNKAASQILAEAHSGTATEQRAMWNKILHDDQGHETGSKFLPQGFSISGAEGHHTVKDGKGHVVYNEDQVSKQADKDAQIHNGEGPYQSLRRQGMTHEEAMRAAHDYKETQRTGDQGVKAGDTTKADADGKGSWHRFDSARADAQGQAAYDQRNNEIDQQQKLVNDNFGNFSSGGLFSSKHLSLDTVDAELKAGKPDQQQRFLQFVHDHYDQMKSENGNVTDASIKAYFDKQRRENFV